ncbi:MAG: C45 family autoproteolytic acyltransferase/hydrolase [Actinomycetota bacterium]|nr:C45 family autoproteolytic acyltransferase/hydrolase [Actinomycetota bacterium]MDH5313524.1 C45 family autoproteolytic acyltransferase/hydrolase [Actinomycetota bacterium]
MAMLPGTGTTFRMLDEPVPGAKLAATYDARAEAYRAWYLQDGDIVRPSVDEGVDALRTHMPELIPTYESLVRDVADHDPLAARMFTLWKPPGAAIACSQAVLQGGSRGSRLARNYDYPAELMDGVILRSSFTQRQVIGVTDVLWGLCDGMNDRGLAVSLTFGGRATMGEGFGVPIVVRYLLETCDTVEDARGVLLRIPIAHTHNLTIADADGHVITAYLNPDRAPSFRRLPIAVNHQWAVESWDPVLAESTLQREWWLLRLLDDPDVDHDRFLSAFLVPPLYSLAHDVGRGTVYTAAYDPTEGDITYVWPTSRVGLRFDSFTDGEHEVTYPPSPASL